MEEELGFELVSLNYLSGSILKLINLKQARF